MEARGRLHYLSCLRDPAPGEKSLDFPADMLHAAPAEIEKL